MDWMGEFNSYDHYIYYCGQESLIRNGVPLIVNKRVRNAVLGCNLKNDSIISVCFQGKPFNITVIQVYVPTTNAEEVEVEQFEEDLKDLLESDQIRSVAQSCPTLCDPMNRRTPVLPVPHQLPEFTQTHVHRVSDAIQPFSSCPQSLPASESFPMSQLFT